MNKFNIGDILDVSKEFSIYQEAVVEDMTTKKNGSIYYKIRGVKTDGSLSKQQYSLWEDTAGITKI